MPSTLQLPTVADLLVVGAQGVRSKRSRADVRRGSMFDRLIGMGAIFWSQQAQYTRDIFLDAYDGSAQGDALTNRIETRYGVTRQVDAYGVGTATLVRANASGGAGRFHEGDRLFIVGLAGQNEPRLYAVSADTDVGATALSATVPIRAAKFGTGQAIDSAEAAAAQLGLSDPVWDAAWRVSALQCADGTDYELADDYRARERQTRIDRRVGYRTAMIQACSDAGAANVALFSSDYGGLSNDHGISACYVGDAGFTASSDLIKDCALALESFRVCGADLLVLPMATSALSVVATAYLWDEPGRLDEEGILGALQTGLLQYFARVEDAFAYRLDAMAGAMSHVTSEVQSTVFTTPSADAAFLVGTPPSFPATLTRYTLSPNDIRITLAGPQ